MNGMVKIVRVAAGKDSGRLMAVTAEKDGCLYVCDGRKRRLNAPKRKNPKHLLFTPLTLEESQLETNKKLRAALYQLERECIQEEI